MRDIRPGPSSSFPLGFTRLGAFLYFTANDGTNGFELWRSDGSPAGTTLVQNINPGAEDSFAGLFGLAMATTGNTLLFGADDGTRGDELWLTDGTTTRLLRDINPSAESSLPLELTNINGYIYFSADNGTQGRELWRTDSTADGTLLVRDINPGAGGSDPSDFFETSGGIVFFSADGGANGDELFSFVAPPPIITWDRNVFLPLVIRAFTPTPTNTPTPTPSPTPGITAFTLTPLNAADQTGAPGNELSYVIRLTNTGTVAGDVTLRVVTSCGAVFAGCVETFPNGVSFANIQPGQAQDFAMNLVIPANARLGLQATSS